MEEVEERFFNVYLASGRFIMSQDVNDSSHMAVLSYDAAVELIGRADAAGETVFLNGMDFLSIGVLAEDDSVTQTMESSDESEFTVTQEAYSSYMALTRMADNILNITRFEAAAESEDSLDMAAVLFSLVIRVIFGIYPAGKAAKKKPIEALRHS